jgi:hypothetical protein
MRVKLVVGMAGFLGVVAALFALGNSRVPIAGVMLCPALLVIWPVFDQFRELEDAWLWTLTAAANALTYALLARSLVAYLRRRSRLRGPETS